MAAPTAQGPAKPVIVGIDGSPAADAAARWAAEEAIVRRVPLRVFHAWMEPVLTWWAQPATVLIDPAVYRDAAQSTAERVAAQLRVDLGERAPEIETLVVQGPTIPELADACVDADLLVLGSRGHGGFAGLLLGSVALGCTHHSTVPIAIIHEPALPGTGDVVVGVDDSDGARTAVRWAAVEAARLGRPLVIAHGWETPFAVPPGGLAYGPVLDSEFERASKELLDAMVAEAVDGLEEPPVISTRVVPATAPTALIEAAQGASLLVVGSRGRGGFAGLVLGSVSQQCIHHAPCPIVVVPGDPADGKAADRQPADEEASNRG